MINPARLNRLASLAILPLVGVAFWFALRAQSNNTADLTGEGTLIVANLRGESLVVHPFSGDSVSTTVPLPGAPHELLLTGDSLYVTLGRDGAIVAIDASRWTVRQVLPIAGQPHGLASDGEALYVSLDEADEVVRLGLPALGEQARYPAGDTPHAVVFDEGRLTVTASREKRLLRIAPHPGSAPAGETPESLAVAGPYLATADAGSGTVSLFDRETLAQVTTIAVGLRPVRVVTFDSSTLLVAVGGTGELAVIDLERMVVEKRVDVGTLPDGICVSPSGEYVAVLANAAETVSIIDTRAWRVRATFEAPGGPGACLWTASD